MATNEQNNLGTTRDDTVLSTDRALAVAIKGGATQGTVPVSGTITANPAPAANSAVTRVAASAANQTLLAANASRVSAGFCNNATSANLYIKLGATASLAAGSESFTVKVPAGGFFRLGQYEYTGRVDGIWDSAEAGAECLITELTP